MFMRNSLKIHYLLQLFIKFCLTQIFLYFFLVVTLLWKFKMFNLVALYFINFFCFRACRNFALMICTLINNYNRPLWFKHIPENGCSQRHGRRNPLLALKCAIFGAGLSFPVTSQLTGNTGTLAQREGPLGAAQALQQPMEAVGICFKHASKVSGFLHLFNITK